MPIDAVWCVATVPRKEFEEKILELQGKKYLLEQNDDESSRGYQDRDRDHIEGRIKFMENEIESALEFLNIQDSVWIPSKNGHYYHIYFATDLDNNDYTMHYLKSRGIGSKRNTGLGYIPFGLFYYNEKKDPNDPLNFNQEHFLNVKNTFLKSVTARLTVAQVVDGVRNGAEMTFDYYMYVFWSSVIAAMGIMNTSPIDVAASMMIEPLMGSVMAISFGLAIWNFQLCLTGLKSLSSGFLFCLIFGFLFGLLFQIWREAWNPPPNGDWPTSEMSSRGEYRTLIYGAVIASAGGAVLSVILLRNNITALTGVAVATTFMPPMVNAGLCWALSVHLQISSNGQEYQAYNFSGHIYWLKPAYAPPDGYSVVWSYDLRVECLILGAISFAYSMVNVFFLLFFSYIMLKVKEIIPLRNFTATDSKFFHQDIKMYKDHMRKHRGTKTGEEMGKQILEEWADISGINKNALFSEDSEAKAAQIQTLGDIVADVEADPAYKTITQNAFGKQHQNALHRRLTQPNLGSVPLFNQNFAGMNIYGNDEAPISNINDDSVRGEPPGFRQQRQSLRQSLRHQIPFNTTSPYSVWPSTSTHEGSVARNRSRTASVISGHYTSKL